MKKVNLDDERHGDEVIDKHKVYYTTFSQSAEVNRGRYFSYIASKIALFLFDTPAYLCKTETGNEAILFCLCKL